MTSRNCAWHSGCWEGGEGESSSPERPKQAWSLALVGNCFNPTPVWKQRGPDLKAQQGRISVLRDVSLFRPQRRVSHRGAPSAGCVAWRSVAGAGSRVCLLLGLASLVSGLMLWSGPVLQAANSLKVVGHVVNRSDPWNRSRRWPRASFFWFPSGMDVGSPEKGHRPKNWNPFRCLTTQYAAGSLGRRCGTVWLAGAVQR